MTMMTTTIIARITAVKITLHAVQTIMTMTMKKATIAIIMIAASAVGNIVTAMKKAVSRAATIADADHVVATHTMMRMIIITRVDHVDVHHIMITITKVVLTDHHLEVDKTVNVMKKDASQAVADHSHVAETHLRMIMMIMKMIILQARHAVVATKAEAAKDKDADGLATRKDTLKQGVTATIITVATHAAEALAHVAVVVIHKAVVVAIQVVHRAVKAEAVDGLVILKAMQRQDVTATIIINLIIMDIRKGGNCPPFLCV